MSEMFDPSPTVIWFCSLATAQPDSNNDGAGDEHLTKTRHAHAKRSDRTRRPEDERARLIRLIG